MQSERDNGQNGRKGQAWSTGSRKALRSDAAGRVYGKHGGYRKLKAYQVAELVYDYTCRFCDRYIPRKDRAANLGAILSAQAHFLTQRLLDRHAQDFEKDGGFSERLYKARTRRWRKPEQTNGTDKTD